MAHLRFYFYLVRALLALVGALLLEIATNYRALFVIVILIMISFVALSIELVAAILPPTPQLNYQTTENVKMSRPEATKLYEKWQNYLNQLPTGKRGIANPLEFSQ